MAYKDATGAFMLTREEQTAALSECVYGEGMPHLKRWDQLDKAHQAETTHAFLRKHPERRPSDTNELPGAKSGLTDSQLRYVADAIDYAVREMLPELVHESVHAMVEIDNDETEEKLRKEWRAEFGAALGRIKNVDLPIIKSNIERVEKNLTAAPSTATRQQSAPNERDVAAMESLERRASRQGDHLQRLEDRIRKLEGKA